jgi:XTP/dITP diphosphohydrolase
LLLATRNAGKAREIAAIYAHLPVEIVTLEAFPDVAELPEDGAAYAENAASKAAAAANATGLVALADDSGVEIDALDGGPGPQSRRFLGNDATDEDRNRRILELLADVPDGRRTARYRAVVAIARPGAEPRVFEGTCEGTIGRAPRGRGGFGYDPVFVVTPDGRTIAEISFDEKNRISHRAHALRAAESYVVWATARAGEERPAPDANTSSGARRAAGRSGTPAGAEAPDESASGGR